MARRRMAKRKMAKRDDEYWRQIAGEYVLGTLRGRARRRFERLRKRDAYYCEMADEWERRLGPLAESLPEFELPREVARLWKRASLLAITLEPAGGRKPGTKLGPILFSGPISALPH